MAIILAIVSQVEILLSQPISGVIRLKTREI